MTNDFETVLTGDCRAVMPVQGHFDMIVKADRGGRHPTEKPTALLDILIRTSCPEGGLVGDWFAGAGSAGQACKDTRRRYIGCEIDPAMAERARRRIEASDLLDLTGRAG